MNRFFALLATIFPFARRADSSALTPISTPAMSAGGVANRQSRLGMAGYDPGASALPTPAYRLTVSDQDTLYEDNGYARRIIDEVVEDALRKGWRVSCGEGVVEDKALRAADEQLGLKAQLGDAAKAGRKYGTAYLMMIFDEEPNALKDGVLVVDLARPPRRVKAILNLVMLDPDECYPVEWGQDARDRATYREPIRYQVSPSAQGGQVGGGYVHASRLLIFRGHRLSPRRRALNQYRDLSVLQPTWAQISNLTQGDSALATNLQDASVGVLKIAGKAALDLGDQWELVEGRLRELSLTKSRIGLLVLDETEEYGVVAHPQGGLHEQHDRLRQGLSAASGMPQTRLFGIAPGGLNADGESQAGSWREQVASYQQDDLAPELERYYTYQMQALGRDPGEDWRVVFAPLDEPTEAQRSEQRAKTAEQDERYIRLGVYTPAEVRAQRFGSGGWQGDLTFSDPLDAAHRVADPAPAPSLPSPPSLPATLAS